ncbi:hypothetical protein BDB01DRAFT_783550 [Pilobolus umbonatus]|nr:hypothetical protein BDB01DRAFT_783550 [Pilobolus umbonatus]
MYRTKPLKTIKVNELSRIPVYYHEPLFERHPDRTQIGIHTMELCGDLELILKRIERLHKWTSVEGIDEQLVSLDKRVQGLVNDIRLCWISIKDTNEYVYRLKLNILYPLSIQYIMKEVIPYTEVNNPCDLNEIYTVACQIYHELNESINHQFIAHQLVLIYQCMNRNGVQFQSFKNTIEDLFGDIRSSSLNGQLNTDQIERLQFLTLSVISLIIDEGIIKEYDPYWITMQQFID